MGPIVPVSIASARPSLSIGATADTRHADAATANMASAASSITQGSLRTTSVTSAVSQLLQDIGGGLENDKLLQLLIALLILMALMENSQGSGATEGGGSSNRGMAMGGQSPLFTLTASSTTISIQHTSISMTAMTAAQAFEAADQPQIPGGQVDITA